MVTDVSEGNPALSSRRAENILFLSTLMTDIESFSETLLLDWVTQIFPKRGSFKGTRFVKI
jgi:hypothetical protein